MQLVDVEPGQSAAEAERALESAGGVLYAEPTGRQAFLRPNDPYFPQLWAMENTASRSAGSPARPTRTRTRRTRGTRASAGGTVVAVVDTGRGRQPCRPRAEHAGQLRRVRPRETTGGRRPQRARGDCAAGPRRNDPADENGHGTHVAGTIAADRGNGVGVAGIADNAAKVLPLRVLDGAGSGRVSDVIQAYAYAFSGREGREPQLGSTSSSARSTTRSRPSRRCCSWRPRATAARTASATATTSWPPTRARTCLPNVLCVAASDNRDQLAAVLELRGRVGGPGRAGGEHREHLAGRRLQLVSGPRWPRRTSRAPPRCCGPLRPMRCRSTSALPSSRCRHRPAFTGRTVSGGRLNVMRSLRQVADVSVGEPRRRPRPDGGSGSQPPGRGERRGRATGGVGDAVPPRLSIRRGRRLRTTDPASRPSLPALLGAMHGPRSSCASTDGLAR